MTIEWWIEALRAIWKQQTSIALAFLAAINRAGIPNESPYLVTV
jgi:hypothetical protein